MTRELNRSESSRRECDVYRRDARRAWGFPDAEGDLAADGDAGTVPGA